MQRLSASTLIYLGLAIIILILAIVGESSPSNEPKNATDKLAVVDKEWIGRQRQILILLNAIHNCKHLLNKTEFSILDHLAEYANSSMVKNYVQRGFNDVKLLFDIFWHNWNNSGLIYKTGVDLLKNHHVDPVEFFYALGSVIVNKPEGHRVQPVYDIFPKLILGRSEDELEIDDITKLNRNPGIDYYLEDPGLRSFYVNWFLHNPFWWKDKEYNGTKERTGELFLYVVHQLYARYNAARIVDKKLKKLKDWKLSDKDPFVNEIDSKLRDMIYQSGPEPNIKHPLNQVGKLILKFFPNEKNYFLEILNIAKKESKTGKGLESLYKTLKYIEKFTLGAREHLVQHQYTEADLEFDGVTLDSLKVIYKSKNKTAWKQNTFYTNWNYKSYYVKKCDKTVTIEKRILDHSEFFYELQIESLLDSDTPARVDIFLSTKFDIDGKLVQPTEYQKYMFHQDSFQIMLKTGENKLHRSSKLSTLSSRGGQSYLKQIQQLLDAEAGYVQLSVPIKNWKHSHNNCGFPTNLMIPKGGEVNRPRKFILLAFITPISGEENHQNENVVPPFNLCEGGRNFGKSFGYPFDRGFAPDNLLEGLKNYRKIQVDGIMLGEIEYSEDL